MFLSRFSPCPALLPLMVLGVGCSLGTQTGDTSPAATGYSVLTRSELSEVTPSSNVYDAIRLLRSRWLSPTRGRWAPTVVVDNVRTGGLENLRYLRLEAVKEVRFVSAREATTRWGTNNSGGVIEVILGDWLVRF